MFIYVQWISDSDVDHGFRCGRATGRDQRQGGERRRKRGKEGKEIGEEGKESRKERGRRGREGEREGEREGGEYLCENSSINQLRNTLM